MKKGPRKFNFTVKNPGSRRSKKEEPEFVAETSNAISKPMKIRESIQDPYPLMSSKAIPVQIQPAVNLPQKAGSSSIFGFKHKESKGVLGKLLLKEPKISRESYVNSL